MVTVSADADSVESRLLAGEISCPGCVVGVLGGWGFARSRSVVGAAGRLRPRRARCRSCRVTHVLLPVVLLLRRAYLAELVWAALSARARDQQAISFTTPVPEPNKTPIHIPGPFHRTG